MHLCAADRTWRDRLIVLESAEFPRAKLCAGGLTRWVDAELAQLGLRLGVPYEAVDDARFSIGDTLLHVRSSPAFRVVRRRDFDDWLFRTAIARGVRVHEGAKVLDVRRTDGLFEIRTSQGTFRTKLVVGADGANSRVRQALGFPVGRRGRLLEVVTASDVLGSVEHLERAATFDFTALLSGVQGYVWHFPTREGGVPATNSGIVDMRVDRAERRPMLIGALTLALRGRGLESDRRIEGAGLRWYQPFSPIGGPGVVLVGDAAGVDAFAGEGIPFALAYGRLSAQAITRAFDRNTYEFSRLHWTVMRTDWGRQLLIRRCLAELVFRRHTRAICVAVFRHWVRRQGSHIRFGVPQEYMSAPAAKEL